MALRPKVFGITVRVALRRLLQRALNPDHPRRIVLHIGPHKTATTSIQYLLEHNHARLPLSHDLIRRSDSELADLTRLLHGLRTTSQASAALPEICTAARRLAGKTRFAPVTVISHEDLLGLLPTRHGVKGLYALVPIVFPAMLAALAEQGAAIDIVFYLRDWKDWMRSVYEQKRGKHPQPAFDATSFSRRNRLPPDWQAFLAVLKDAVQPHQLHIVSFDQERNAGFMGLSLLQIASLSPRQIARLHRTPPRNVTRPETLQAGTLQAETLQAEMPQAAAVSAIDNPAG